jgi:hypothetical protein
MGQASQPEMHNRPMENGRLRQLAKAYLIAKRCIIKRGYATEIDWQYSVSLSDLDERTFLSESAWVILCSGMRESVVRKKFDSISEAFLNWKSALAITDSAQNCAAHALKYFNNPSKIDAIQSVASHVARLGFDRVKERITNEGIKYLQELPYVGPVTSFHLAKNIGLPVAKPDRHLCRLAKALGYDCVQHLCSDVAQVIQEPIPVVDIVLWRYSTLFNQKLCQFYQSVSNNIVFRS